MRVLALLIGLSHLGIGHVEGKEIPRFGSRGRTECPTEECKTAGQTLSSYLNSSIDPCDDFYEFVCQRWTENTTVSEERGSYGAFDIVQEKLQLDLKKIFEDSKDDKGKSCIIAKLKDAYRACTDENFPEARTLEALADVLATVGMPNWPHMSTTSATPKWEDIYPKLVSELGITPIFSLSIGQDSKNVSYFTLMLDQMDFTMIGRNELINQSDPQNKPIADAYKDYIAGAVKIMNNGQRDDKEARRVAEEIAKFEGELAEMTRRDEERRDHAKMYRKMTILELQKELPQVMWIEVFNNIFHKSVIKIPISLQDTLVIFELNYYKSALKFLETQDRHVVFNYFGWQVLSMLGPVDSKKFGDLKVKLDNATRGITKRPEKWKRCVDHLNDLAEHAVGRMYADEKFSREAKDDMLHLVKVLVDTFKEMLKENTWMDDETRATAIAKVNTMSPKIGYPDWVKDNAELEKVYRYVLGFKKGTPYVTMYANLMKNYALVLLSKVHDVYDKSYEWVTGAAVVNAFYYQGGNEIVFPAGILKRPFYERGLPIAINMGAIGMVIGHEITHGFDDEGSQYGADGSLKDWWNVETKKTFREKAQCFVDQYGKTGDEQSGKYLNGVNTQGENIADNGGLRAAYKALQAAKREPNYKDMYLPGWEDLESDKLFFISNALVWCTKHKTGALIQAIQYDYHSPAKYRVNIPMSNMKEFSEVFSCSSSSRMNASTKCAIW
ncbi:neprilysin-4-like [Ornithodoros turicata]|uniref:neprilysin-4-like n=1 Tax=Ornithodoros turicata TaxID=34597 RepID=UPI003139239D